MLHTDVYMPLIKHCAYQARPLLSNLSIDEITRCLLLTSNQESIFSPTYRHLKPAAVLIGLIDHPQGIRVLLTKRTAHLSKHAGQIAFPGGRYDVIDKHVITTALRETYEEVGLESDKIKIIGRLEPLVTRTGYVVAPVVARLNTLASIKSNPTEVEQWFTVPFDYFLNPQHFVAHRNRSAPHSVRFISIPWQEHFIWGVTAAIFYNFYIHLSNQQVN